MTGNFGSDDLLQYAIARRRQKTRRTKAIAGAAHAAIRASCVGIQDKGMQRLDAFQSMISPRGTGSISQATAQPPRSAGVHQRTAR